MLALSFINWSDAAGFDYPDTMPTPQDAHATMLFLAVEYMKTYETPIQARFSYLKDSVFWNCLVVYHPTALDMSTQHTPIRADNDTINEYGTDETMVLCGSYANFIVSEDRINQIFMQIIVSCE